MCEDFQYNILKTCKLMMMMMMMMMMIMIRTRQDDDDKEDKWSLKCHCKSTCLFKSTQMAGRTGTS